LESRPRSSWSPIPKNMAVSSHLLRAIRETENTLAASSGKVEGNKVKVSQAWLVTQAEMDECGPSLAKKGLTLIGHGTVEVDTKPEPSLTTMKVLASETGVTSVWENIEAHGKMEVTVKYMRLAILMRLTDDTLKKGMVPAIAGWLTEVSDMLIQCDHVNAAMELFTLAIPIIEPSEGAITKQSLRMRVSMGELKELQRDFSGAIKEYHYILENAGTMLAPSIPGGAPPEAATLAGVRESLGTALLENKQVGAAEAFFTQAVKELEPQDTSPPAQSLRWAHFCMIRRISKESKAAIELCKTELQFRRQHELRPECKWSPLHLEQLAYGLLGGQEAVRNKLMTDPRSAKSAGVILDIEGAFLVASMQDSRGKAMGSALVYESPSLEIHLQSEGFDYCTRTAKLHEEAENMKSNSKGGPSKEGDGFSAMASEKGRHKHGTGELRKVQVEKCGGCQKANPNLQVCKGCGLEKYCGAACQKTAWPAHMELCKSIQLKNKLEKANIHE